MLKHRPRPTLTAVLIGLAAAADAAALGFGRAPQAAVLGQPLDFAVPLRLAAGETLGPECVSAEVLVGESVVAPYQVRAELQPAGGESATLRVTTAPVINEPVVTVTVHAGCGTKVSRRFVLLADPPGTAAPVAFTAPPAAGALLVADAAPALPERTSDIASPVAVAFAAPASAPIAALPAALAASAPPRPAEASPPPQRTNTTAPPQPRPRAATAPKPSRPAVTTAARNAAPVPAATPRLKLDPAESAPLTPSVAVIEEAMAAVAEAASAARASAVAASAAEQRINALERDVQTLRLQAQASQDEAARWRAQAQAGSTSSRWITPLVLTLALITLVCVWLALRLRSARQAQQRSWLRAAGAAPATPSPSLAPVSTATPITSPIPLVNSELELPPKLVRTARTVPTKPPLPAVPVAPAMPATAVTAPAPAAVTQAAPTPADAPAMERTAVLEPNLRFDSSAARDVSIEELLDLEQQAEFFIALGQDEAAIDLLVEHLRSTGGGSPLPYLKLLEIYRRRDDPQAYERTRARFNDRFNAYAPDWDSDLLAGRALEEYEGIVPRLQLAWPRPLDAMAELEALLFRKSRGELFDLPAYREVLFLYALARDLLEREPAEAPAVDILLPLAEGDSAPMPLASPSSSDGLSDRPTEPVDLDLSGPNPSDSLFAELTASRRTP